MQKEFDTLVIGPVSLDHNIDCEGNERREVGGAIVASGFASANSGSKTALFTKLNSADADVNEVFRDIDAELFYKPSAQTTSIRNKYFTPDKERRECRAIGKCDPFEWDELPKVSTKIYHFAGLMYGDFSGELFKKASEKAKVAVDVQCLLRHAMPDGSMSFFDWEQKKEYLPYIDFLKTDAAEAQILTGLEDRQAAARTLYSWGAREVMITHNTEVIVYDGNRLYACPLKARNLSGRTGRGDTCFAGYITERLKSGIAESILYAAALVSLKMETPGPFRGNRADVLKYITDFYS